VLGYNWCVRLSHFATHGLIVVKFSPIRIPGMWLRQYWLAAGAVDLARCNQSTTVVETQSRRYSAYIAVGQSIGRDDTRGPMKSLLATDENTNNRTVRSRRVMNWEALWLNSDEDAASHETEQTHRRILFTTVFTTGPLVPCPHTRILYLSNILCVLYACVICVFFVWGVFFLYNFFLQYFDTVGWVFWPVKTVSRITYTVLVGT